MLMRLCKSKKMAKFLAIMLIITMTFANLMFLGKNLISFAFEENLETQGLDTQHNNVKFDAYLSDNGGNTVHSVVFDVTNSQPQINLYLSVKKAGYLKEAYIDFRDTENSTNTNYEIVSEQVDNTLVQNVNIDQKTISLNYINSGTETVMQVPIKLDFENILEINKIRKNSLVTLRGLYIDENGKETEISKTVKLNIGWNIETELNIEQAITKYIPYSYEGKEGLILQLSIKAKQNREDTALPVMGTNLKIKVPEIAENLPEKVVVSANSTMATNGDKVVFTSEDWTYNAEEKIITINAKGYEENGLAWAGNGTDEYFVTYIYSSEVYKSVIENEIALHSEVEGEMNLYTVNGVTSKTAISSGDVVLNQKIGDMITYSIDAEQTEISKGKMYANYNAEEKLHSAEYNSTIKANVSNFEIIDEVYMVLGSDNFKDENNIYTTNIAGIYYTTYKQISIDKAQVQTLLGDDGIINIYDNYSNVYTINKETQDVDGKYVIDFAEGVGEVRIQTSKPVEDGIFKIDTVKSISKELIYSKDQVMSFKELKLNVSGYTRYAGMQDYSMPQTAEDTINLTETSTNAKFEISNTSLTSMAENKNVEMKILLNNNVETSDLYKNPVFTINLPKYIEDIEITGGNILYTNGLEIDYVERNYTENGIVLKVFTKGAESDFSSGVFTNGTNIVLNTNIKVSMLTPNVSDKIVMTYTNENAIAYSNGQDGYGIDEVEVNFVAPEEMVTFNTVLTSGAEFTSLEGNEQTAKLEILDASKTATMKISILNKYSNVCNNIRILGRTPFVGNKSIVTGTDLGTTFDAKLVSGINTNGLNAIVYYSANENATEDIEDVNNAWTTDWMTLENVKSYLIVVQNYEMQPGEILEFTYECQIPESLEHNESAYGTYAVYFDSVSQYVAQNSIEATKVGLTTGIGANIETSTEIVYQGNTISEQTAVREYQYITYKTTVKNTGTVDATGVRLATTLQNGTIEKAEGATITGNQLYYELGELKSGKETTVVYTVKVNAKNSVKIEGLVSKIETDESGNEVEKYYMKDETSGKYEEVNLSDYYRVFNSTIVTAQNFEGQLENTVSNEINEAEFSIKIGSTLPENTIFTKDQKITYNITIKNVTANSINNATMEMYLPEGLEFVSANGTTYNETTRMITYKIDNIGSGSTKSIVLITKSTIGNGIGKLEPTLVAQISATNKYVSNEYKMIVVAPVISVEQLASVTNNTYIKEGTSVTFNVKVKNSGEAIAETLKISEMLPKEFKVVGTQCKVGDKSYRVLKDGQNYYTYVDIEPNQEAILTITAQAKIDKTLEESKVDVYANVSSKDINEIQSNKLTYTIEKSSQSQNPSNPSVPTQPTYKITGTAWLDENEDGKKGQDEKLLEGIDVILIDANTGVIVTDKTNGTIKQTKTSKNGTYTFTNLPNGKYIVIFEYDSSYYDVTTYKKEGLSEDETSKAIQSKINKDGKISIAGITDAITISNESKSNINVGLVVKPKFDLSLEKTITKMTVQNAAGTKSYTFADTKLAKVEIPGKYLNNSKVYVEYKIKVKNEGQVAGYARKIVDYMSPDFTFEPSNNPMWDKGADGNLYNESLAQTLLQPGQEKELTLVLEKTMTEDNTGIVSNVAEIYETYNEQNLEDHDSTVGNLAQGEDDLSNADALISVKTGQIALYIIITLISITIIATGIYLINKKVLRGGKI